MPRPPARARACTLHTVLLQPQTSRHPARCHMAAHVCCRSYIHPPRESKYADQCRRGVPTRAAAKRMFKQECLGPWRRCFSVLITDRRGGFLLWPCNPRVTTLKSAGAGVPYQSKQGPAQVRYLEPSSGCLLPRALKMQRTEWPMPMLWILAMSRRHCTSAKVLVLLAVLEHT